MGGSQLSWMHALSASGEGWHLLYIYRKQPTERDNATLCFVIRLAVAHIRGTAGTLDSTFRAGPAIVPIASVWLHCVDSAACVPCFCLLPRLHGASTTRTHAHAPRQLRLTRRRLTSR